MIIKEWTEKIAITVGVMFFAIFITYIGYARGAETTADTIILRDGSRSYACQTRQDLTAPHNCKPVKEKS